MGRKEADWWLSLYLGVEPSDYTAAVGGEWFTDEIAELGSKHAAMQSAGVWIVELAALDSMNRSKVSKIKAFMSRSTDRFRVPYGRRVIEAPRHSISPAEPRYSEPR